MLIDSHAHLDMKDFDRDREEVLERAVKEGISQIITVGIDLESSLSGIDLSRTHKFIYASVGCHPHHADDCDGRVLNRLAALAADRKVVAWGEIGLDFYRRFASPNGQMHMFSRQLELAADLGLPVIIHDRDAHFDVLTILKGMGEGERKGVVHCFSGDLELAMSLIGLGYYISIPGTVTYKNAVQTKEVAANLPLECMLIETDAPFLAPEPKRGKRNEPQFLAFTAREIARLRNTDYQEVALQTAKNARILFDLPQTDG